MGVFLQRLGLLFAQIAGGFPLNGNISFLSGFNGVNAATTAVDHSIYNHTLTFAADAQLSTTTPKFGSACVIFDGTGDVITVTQHVSFHLQNEDFTIEGWWRASSEPPAPASNVIAMWKESGSNRSWLMQYEPGTDTLKCYISTTGANVIMTASIALGAGGGDLWDGNWHHVAWTRQGNVYRVFVDGIIGSVSNTQSGSLKVPDSATDMSIGASYTANENFPGTLDEIRITKGLARYTGAFTPPTTPFPREGPFSWINDFATSNDESPRFIADFSGVVNGQYYWDNDDTKSFDDTVDVTRDDDAGYWDSSGVFQFAGTDAHRLDHDPDTNVRLGLLREDTQTTIIDRSKDTNTNPWFKVNVTATTNVVTAPDGFLTADKVRETTINNKHRLYSNPGGLTATPWTTTFRISPAGRTWYKIRLDVTGQFKGAYVQLTGNGTVGIIDSGYICRIKKLGNDWWDVELTREVATTAAHFPSIHAAVADGDDSYAGDVAKGWDQARANLINSKIGSSLINMPASIHITRNADIVKVKVDGSLPHDGYIQGQGTMAGTFTLKIVTDLDQTLMNYSTEGSNHRIECYVNSSGTLFGRVTVSGSTISTVNLGSVSDDTEFTVALSFIDNALRGSKNGGSVVSDTGSMTVPDADALYLGHRSASGLDGANVLWISKIMYYENAFDGAELQSAG